MAQFAFQAGSFMLSPPYDNADALARMVVRLRRDYAAPLQVIATYSSPIAVHVQEALEEIARRDPKFLLLYADRGRSKVEALNAALARAEGEFVGIFNTCQLPDRRVFNRAWMWLSNAVRPGGGGGSDNHGSGPRDARHPELAGREAAPRHRDDGDTRARLRTRSHGRRLCPIAQGARGSRLIRIK